MTYHISPESGRPNKCRAQKGNCPFGSDEQHYETKDAARAGFEESMKDSTVPSSAKASSKPSPAVTAEFEKHVAELPKYLLNKKDQKTLDDLSAGKAVTDEKLDEFVFNNRFEGTLTPTATSPEAFEGVLNHMREIRKERGTPSTLATLESFDPAKETLFSNPAARKTAAIAGKALKRELAHAEWMYELAAETEVAAAYATDDFDRQRYKQERTNLLIKGREAEARVQAQLKEVQYLYDTDPAFAESANSEVKRALAKGWFRPKASFLGGLPIGSVKKIK